MRSSCGCSSKRQTLATRNSRDFPLELGGIVHPYRL